MKKIFLNILVVLVIVVGGAVVALVGMRLRSRPSDAEIIKERKPTNVAVEVLGTTTVEDVFSLMGSLEPWADVTLSAKTMGEIEWLGIEEGQFVRAGQELLRIDTSTLRVNLEQARARKKLAVQELERIEKMRADGISSPQDMDRALADHEVAVTNLRATEIQLADSVVVAKFDGLVDALHQEEGEYVSPGMPLVRLVQVDRVKLIIGIPERDVVRFAIDDLVAVTLDAFPGETFEGKIFLIATTAEKSTHTFVTEIVLDNPAGILKPGMIAQARLVRQSFPDSIMVPMFSVITTDAGRHAFVEEDGVARIRQVKIGFIHEASVHITKGLGPGDRLIVVGHRDLVDGDAVQVREAVK